MISTLPNSLQPFADPLSLLAVIAILYFKPNGLLAPTAERA